MMTVLLCVLVTFSLFVQNEAARILAVFPTPEISHQKCYRSIIHELIHRGHEVVLITPTLEYARDSSPDNLMEIDVSDVTYDVWEETYIKGVSGKSTKKNEDVKIKLQVAAQIVEKQFEVPEVISFIKNNETFDLLLLEAIRPTLFWTYIYDAPVVSVSSEGAVFNDYINMGGPAHPLLYPTLYQQEVWNINIWNTIGALYDDWKMSSLYNSLEKEEDVLANRMFGDVPSLKKQMAKIEMLLLNIHPVWQGTRPVAKNVVHLGVLHLQDRENKTEMSEDLLNYLDSSFNGVVYVNLGTNIRPWMMSEQTQLKLLQAFGKLPCSVLWRWDGDISIKPPNVVIGKSFPQAELLMHPNIRLFITQCGQQSMDEAIAAEVPILGIPVAADQQRNAELLVRHNIGTTLDLDAVGAKDLRNIIEHTMRNETYRTNIRHLRSIIFDMPTPAPVLAADAIDYVLRHTGGHLVPPSLNVNWFQYMEIELLIVVNVFLFLGVFITYKLLFHIFKMMVKRFTKRRIVREGFKSLL